MGLGLAYHWAPLTAVTGTFYLNLHSHKEGSTPPKYIKNLIKFGKNRNHKISVKFRGGGMGGRVGW